jgi:hypothetical protein
MSQTKQNVINEIYSAAGGEAPQKCCSPRPKNASRQSWTRPIHFLVISLLVNCRQLQMCRSNFLQGKRKMETACTSVTLINCMSTWHRNLKDNKVNFNLKNLTCKYHNKDNNKSPVLFCQTIHFSWQVSCWSRMNLTVILYLWAKCWQAYASCNDIATDCSPTCGDACPNIG